MNAEFIQVAADIFNRIPEGIFAHLSVYNQNTAYQGAAQVKLQAGTQDEVKAVRKALGAKTWAKQYDERNHWWEYVAKINGVVVTIYACYEAPPACHKITEEVVVEEQVPVAFETRTVTRLVEKWKCD